MSQSAASSVASYSFLSASFKSCGTLSPSGASPAEDFWPIPSSRPRLSASSEATKASGVIVLPALTHPEGCTAGILACIVSPMNNLLEGGDRYEVTHLLGQGGMGAVYEAYDKRRERKIAMKVLRDPE